MPDNPAFEKWHKEHYPRAHALVKDAKRDIFRQMLRAAWEAATERAAKIADESQAKFEADVRSMRPSVLMEVAQGAANVSGRIAAAIREGANHAE